MTLNVIRVVRCTILIVQEPSVVIIGLQEGRVTVLSGQNLQSVLSSYIAKNLTSVVTVESSILGIVAASLEIEL